MNIDNKLKSKLNKLLALAREGVGGEKENASRMLENLLSKHNLSMDDILDDTRKTYWFRYRGVNEHELLNQIINLVVQGSTDLWSRRNKRQLLGADLTKTEYVQVKVKFDIYRRAFNKEVRLLLQAFIIKNTIYHDTGSDKSLNDLSESDLERIFKLKSMIDGLNRVTIDPLLTK